MTPTTVRQAVKTALNGQLNLLDTMREYPVEERGEINRPKLGWLLKKNANRIVGGLELRKAEADGRTAWRVVADKSPHSPPLPPSSPLVGETITAGMAGYEHGQIKNSSEVDMTDGWDELDESIKSLNPNTPAPPLKNF